ncbi:DNA cytosine methyltransferase [Nitrospirillum viridazoti]|uniref:Cytosine-specific methyltransferase n=1 Tax=Nitrospirillum viridazoti CBAmc TaxID=1441467 RepID=A0A248K0T1_9PROT|nr:DNA cytosine methyltransferase [Nitrospirillum amazonense]ASG24034.1 DNA (cytosine-5-)-methyltransferase [Nitrospirillum amazonense CBAmc]TWB26067.1 DNA (cytosine-5)-methyltransferase 1 [Nitrospirillum amazonense]
MSVVALPEHVSSLTIRPRSDLVAVDLFAGAGGFSLGATLAGLQVIAAVEKDKDACRTYRTNLVDPVVGGPKLFEEDILEVDPHRLMDDVGLVPGACDVLIGGPPCQGFSTHRLKNVGIDDPRNRLLLRYFEFVAALRPKFFLVENVPGLLWPRHEKYLRAFYEKAVDIGYAVETPRLLNARDFGVPQNRKRVFLLGRDTHVALPEVAWPPAPSHRAPGDVEGERNGLPSWRVAAEVFSVPTPEPDPNSRYMNPSPQMVQRFASTPLDGGTRHQSNCTLPCHDGHDGHNDVYGRINTSVPGPTMTTACINPSKGRFVHPFEHHGITLRQAARFQAFPDWFVFQGGLMSCGAQIGNAVPVEMGRALLRPFVVATAKCGENTPAEAA